MNGAKRTGADEAVWKAMKCRVDAESARSQRPNKRVARDRRPIAVLADPEKSRPGGGP